MLQKLSHFWWKHLVEVKNLWGLGLWTLLNSHFLEIIIIKERLVLLCKNNTKKKTKYLLFADLYSLKIHKQARKKIEKLKKIFLYCHQLKGKYILWRIRSLSTFFWLFSFDRTINSLKILKSKDVELGDFTRCFLVVAKTILI